MKGRGERWGERSRENEGEGRGRGDEEWKERG